MDELLRQLKLPGLVIMDVADHAAIYDRRNAFGNKGPLFLSLDGYDDPVRYDAATFNSVRDQLFFRFTEEIRDEIREISEALTGDGLRIVIIRRLPADKFYSQAECEIQTAGSERRSIANIEELRSVALRHSDNVLVAALEGRSLFYQMALFAVADIVVCQHGAALGNLIWSTNSASVIEVIPRERKDGISECDYFGDLARCLSQQYYRLWQELPHGPVDAVQFESMLQVIIKNASRSNSGVLSSVPADPGVSQLKMMKRSAFLAWQRVRKIAVRMVGSQPS
jgi:hypothetical protein